MEDEFLGTKRSWLPPSPERMFREETALLVVDVQEKLIGAIENGPRVVWNVRRLIDGAKLLGLPILATEQYPQGLGKTVSSLADLLETPIEKTAFSCCGSPALCQKLEALDRGKILLAGIEAHVCVQQTALDLLANGYRVYVAVDAVGSRGALDRQTALERLSSAGATLTTTEAALFEWCQDSADPQFKSISRLVRETPPE